MELSYCLKTAEAKPLLETAIALGAHQATAYYNLAWVIVTANPEDLGDAQPAIDEALVLNPTDPLCVVLGAGSAARWNTPRK